MTDLGAMTSSVAHRTRVIKYISLMVLCTLGYYLVVDVGYPRPGSGNHVCPAPDPMCAGPQTNLPWCEKSTHSTEYVHDPEVLSECPLSTRHGPWIFQTLLKVWIAVLGEGVCISQNRVLFAVVYAILTVNIFQILNELLSSGKYPR